MGKDTALERAKLKEEETARIKAECDKTVESLKSDVLEKDVISKMRKSRIEALELKCKKLEKDLDLSEREAGTRGKLLAYEKEKVSSFPNPIHPSSSQCQTPRPLESKAKNDNRGPKQ